MSPAKMLSALLLAASLAACAQNPPPAPQVASTNPGAASQMPQPPNSLPPDTTVNAPITPQSGVVGETQVAPDQQARPARRHTAQHRRPARHHRAVRPANTRQAPAATQDNGGTTAQ